MFRSLMKTKVALLLVAAAFLLVPLTPSIVGRPSHAAQVIGAPEYTFKIVRVFPHDPRAYTQGLAYRDGFLYEGTGLNGRSSIRKVRLETGEIVRKVDLAPEFFGEGITLFNNEIVQLTWKSQTGFIYSASDFSLLRRFSYSGEGWGLATNGNEIFMSDGTSEIRVLDGSTLREKRRLKVHDGNTAVTELNELEFVEGE